MELFLFIVVGKFNDKKNNQLDGFDFDADDYREYLEMQEEIKGLRTQLHTCLEFIKSYQDNQNNVQNVQEVLSDLQIAEPKIILYASNSEVQSIVEDIVISVEESIRFWIRMILCLQHLL